MRFIICLTVVLILLSCSNDPTAPDPEPQPGNPYNVQIEQLSEEAVKLIWELPEINNNSLVISKKSGEAVWDHEYIELDSGSTSFIDSIYTQAFIVYSYFLTEISDSLSVGTSDTVAFFSDNSLPTEINLEHIKQDSIRISWHDNSYGEFFYGIDKKIGDGNWIEDYINYEPEPANGHNSDMNYVDYNSNLSDSIHYRIYLMNGISKSVKTSSTIYSSLLPPSNLKVTIEGEGIKLTWIDNYQTETGFIIERKTYGNEFEQIEMTAANSQSFLDEELDPNEIYFYRMKVIVNELQSGFSDTVVGCVQHEGYWVPLDYPTIQSAVDACNSLHEVILLPGIYYENVLVQDRYPDIKSLFSLLGDFDFIEQTIIDGSMNGSVFEFVNCNSYNPSITGLTIQSGSGTYAQKNLNSLYYYYGGGIFLESSDIVVTNLHIKNCSSELGGAISCLHNSQCTISACEIINNEAFRFSGGGIYSSSSVLVIEESLINHNQARDGGGISLDESSIIMSNTSVSYNTASHYCGGLDIHDSFTSFENVLIDGNSAIGSGGIGCSGNMIISNTIICNNEAQTGGGIGFRGSKLENVIFYNNSAEIGGAIYTNFANITISNVVAFGNTSSDGGGALYSMHHANPVIENCIFWNNTPQEIMLRPGNQPSTEGTVTVSYSDIQGGIAGVSALYANDIIWLDGNINSDPLFQNPMSNFHLQNNSSCIDAGNPLPEYNDPDGSRNDMGAYGGQNGNW
ncbi:MAG: hypothetical protein DRI23_12560 [Candidatus Cloacimonadota bacterium]|nr:MAG: hypothetical protein DRI23_12560 [Candidatus Cloacimonadota bacterium]RLC49541.1 MAG: hypothetical protein DRH79_08890 [Candidatus Cloacimonadota bacterium]